MKTLHTLKNKESSSLHNPSKINFSLLPSLNMHFYKTNVVVFLAAFFANGMANPVSKPENIIDSRDLLTRRGLPILSCLVDGLLLNIPIISNNQCSNGDTYCCESGSGSKICTQSTTECDSDQTVVCCNTGIGVSRAGPI